MSKNLIPFFFIFMTGILFSCKSGDTKSKDNSVRFEKTEVSVLSDTAYTLKVIYEYDDLRTKRYIISSSAPEVATATLNEEGNVSITKKILGTTTIKIMSEDNLLLDSCVVNVKIGKLKKWLALGNSITKTPVNPSWWGEWGMAASVRENDYAHTLNRMLESHYGNNISFDAVNIALWEDNAGTYDKELLREYASGDEDVIIIRLGENVRSTATYKTDFESLILFLKKISPKANYIITGNFWTSREKDIVQKEVANENNCIWVPLDQLDNSENTSSVNTYVFGEDLSWHSISEAGEASLAVAHHPNDHGMYNIARCIFQVLK